MLGQLFGLGPSGECPSLRSALRKRASVGRALRVRFPATRQCPLLALSGLLPGPRAGSVLRQVFIDVLAVTSRESRFAIVVADDEPKAADRRIDGDERDRAVVVAAGGDFAGPSARAETHAASCALDGQGAEVGVGVGARQTGCVGCRGG